MANIELPIQCIGRGRDRHNQLLKTFKSGFQHFARPLTSEKNGGSVPLDRALAHPGSPLRHASMPAQGNSEAHCISEMKEVKGEG